ncbi:hypothetical protein [Streptomyces broussonetiae]|uniref:hypothetical protein n=1 Tax=Streptomyces broussonetiae TaxID=2686304 RepID=UPI001E592E0D|nr:hypothetical protein [Streptomyces broussonetiae]
MGLAVDEGHVAELPSRPAEGWQSWGLDGEPLIPERMPVLFDDDFLFEDESGPRATRAVNAWLRTLPSSGAPSPNSWRAYALAARDWLMHLRRHRVAVFGTRQELVAALGTYADRRLSGPLDERLEPASGELQVTALSRFYDWAESEGLAAAVPFTVTTGKRMEQGRLVETRHNRARLRRPKPHVKVQYLESDFAVLFRYGLAMPGVRWAGRQATLLSYTKGRTAEESLVLSLRASRLLEQWLRHGAQLRRHAPAELAEHVWLVTRQGKLARAAFEEYMMRAWVKAHDLRGDDGQLLRIDRRRLRTTFIAQRGQRQWSPRATIDPNHSPEAELLSADRHRPGFRPWGKRSPRVVSGAPARPQVVIKTKPLDDDVLRPLLTAYLHLVDVLGPHIVPLRTTLQAEREARRNVDWSRNLRDAERLASLVDAHLRTDQPLPRLEGGQVTKRLRSGWDPKDPLLDVNFQQLLRPTGHRDISKALLVQARTLLEEAVAAVGTEYVWCRNAPDAPRADTGELIPWSLPLSNTGVDSLIRVARHACTVATSALTGMRSSELMELTVGCRRTDDADGTGLARHRLVSKVVKGRLWGGEMDAWVVIEEVVRVIALAEQLTDARPGKPLFGPFNGFESNGAMTWLRQWVASAAGRRMGLDPIPDEPVHPRRLRRTLSVEMAARPGGLLATKVHFKHLQVATSEGYLRLPLMVEDGLGAARTARRRCVSNSAAPGPRQLL